MKRAEDSWVLITPDVDWVSSGGDDNAATVGLIAYWETHESKLVGPSHFVTVAEAVEWARARTTNISIRILTHGDHYWIGEGQATGNEPRISLEDAELQLARVLNEPLA